MGRVGALVLGVVLVTVGALGWVRLADEGGPGDPQRAFHKLGPAGTVVTTAPPPCPTKPADDDPVMQGGASLAWKTGLGAAVIEVAPGHDGVVALDKRGCLFALDAASGASRWVVPTGGGQLRIMGEAALVGGTGYALADGTQIAGAMGEAPLQPGGVLARADGIEIVDRDADRSTGGLRARDQATGRQLWERDLLGDNAKAVVHDGLVLAIASGGVLYGIDLHTGDIRHRTELGGSTFGPLAAFGNRVYVARLDGTFFAVDAAKGGIAWTKLQSIGGLPAYPVATATRAYLAGRQGDLTAFDAASGRVVWSLGGVYAFTAPPVVAPPFVRRHQWRWRVRSAGTLILRAGRRRTRGSRR